MRDARFKDMYVTKNIQYIVQNIQDFRIQKSVKIPRFQVACARYQVSCGPLDVDIMHPS